MITTGFAYLAVLGFVAGCIALLDEKSGLKLFKVLPGIVILYFSVMLLSTFGLWSKTESVNAAYSGVKNNLLFAMIFLLLLKADIRQIAALGPRMLIAFFCASLSIGIGMIATFLALKAWLPDGAWMTFAALSGSWMGGTGNMVAVQGALSIPDSSMGYTLLMDSINYAMWVMFLLAAVPLAPRFNSWAKARGNVIEEVAEKIEANAKTNDTKVTSETLLFLIGGGLLASALSQYLGALLPASDFFSATTWTVLIVTAFGIFGAMTPLGRMAGSSQLGNVLLYFIVALIASRANFAELRQAPLFITAGFMVLAVHGLLMMMAARVFRLDLFSCGVASLSNIGGVASAPILAATYSRALIPVGVLMALLGYIIGTGGGLLIGKILLSLS